MENKIKTPKKLIARHFVILVICLICTAVADSIFATKPTFHAKSSQWAVMGALNFATLVVAAFVVFTQISESLRLMKICPVILSAVYYVLSLLVAGAFIAIEAVIPQQLFSLGLMCAACGFFLFVSVVAFAFDYIASFVVIED